MVRPPALGHWPESSGTTGRHPGPSERGANHQESWSNLRAIGPEAESPGRDGRLRRPSNPGPSCRDSGWTPRGLGTGLESTGRAVRHRRRSHPGASLPGELVKPAGTRSRAQVARGLWSISHNLGHISESPATAGRFRLLRTRARDARDSWSTSRALRAGRVSPGRAGQLQRPLDPSPRHPGQLVDTADPRTWERVVRESWSTPPAISPRPSRPGVLINTSGLWNMARVAP